MSFQFPCARRALLPFCTVLIALTFAAPAAVARPADLRSGAPAGVTAAHAITQDLRNPDNHTVKAALAQERYHSSYGRTGEPAQDLRSPDARDAALGRGTFSVPDIAVVKVPQPAPVADDTIDWGDVGIGAGGALSLTLLALGGTFAVVHRRQGARTTATTG